MDYLFRMHSASMAATRDAAASAGWPAGTSDHDKLLAGFYKLGIAPFLGASTPFGVLSQPYDFTWAALTSSEVVSPAFNPQGKTFGEFFESRIGAGNHIVLLWDLYGLHSSGVINIPVMSQSSSVKKVLAAPVDTVTQAGIGHGLEVILNLLISREYPNFGNVLAASSLGKTIGEVLLEATS